jgi:hypothetical protein
VSIPPAHAVVETSRRSFAKPTNGSKLLEQEAEVMRRAVGYLSRSVNLKLMYPLVLDLAADAVPITVTCRVLGFSTQAFYKWCKVSVPQRDWDDAHLINAARDIHADDPAFGHRFIADELPRRGITAGGNRVAPLCSQERIWSVFAKKLGLTKKCRPTGPRRPSVHRTRG